MTGSVEKVPFFGDLPVIGSLFRYDSRSHNKTNLVVFLRPRILRDPEAYGSITSDRYQDVIGELKKADAHPSPLIPSAELKEDSLPNVPDKIGKGGVAAEVQKK